MDKPNNFQRDQHNRVFAGILLVAVGGALLLRNLNFPLPDWLFSWPMILIIVGLYSGVKHSFRNATWIFLIGIGGFFLIDDFIPELSIKALFWPVIIIGLGILFILRPRRKNWQQLHPDEKYTGYQSTATNQNAFTDTKTDGSDYFDIHSVFSGVKRTILSKNFQGGSISCVFGGVELDLTQADMPGKAIISLEEVFGGTKLVIPSDWVVQNEIDGVFHGVEDKRKYHSAANANPNKVLILRGTSVFAGIEIKSY